MFFTKLPRLKRKKPVWLLSFIIWLVAMVFPFPVGNLRHVETDFMDVLLMLDKLVGHLLVEAFVPSWGSLKMASWTR